ncbi:NAD(P)-dependent oxidoreductase [Protaetiibacter larvae]|uniref:NAD(P)H-binding protein n=1 Tax=Protaetiibacter larvae TaxID=2592654 RepID=A0A5C1YA76_9MICO|nr:NAD(P)H-binding protein [Protaetiibacter larvae]QEO10510.1 NAD(P)H-binding protein [Protaetiibacter larvae]
MRILLFGITGYTGTHLAREALARGHEVLGVSRSLGDAAIPEGAVAVAGNIHDADTVAALADGVDAIVVAVQPIDSDGNRIVDAVPALLDAAEANGARLGVVGGASSLSREPGGPRLIDGDFPEEWKPAAQALIDVLVALRETDGTVDWFFLSPPEHYGSYLPGERRGSYRVGGDELVVGADGTSTIGGEDYAIAFLDELETPTHHATRFTVGY